MRQQFILLFSLALLSTNLSVFSQEYREVFKNFDELVNIENTNLLYGKEYVEQHATINNKHKFFQTSGFLNGDVVYSGETYYDLDLKYNVFEDLLIVRVKKEGGEATYQLFKNRIESFRIDGRNFINISPKKNAEIQGFFEIFSEDASLKLLKNHRKKLKKILTTNFTYFEFEPEPTQYAVAISGKYFKVNSQAGWLDVFPEHKEKIESYFSSNQALKETDPDNFLLRLFSEISESYKSNNS
ncbi:hypothetical protein SAMN05660903_00492 [Salegentibacter salinarum]|nr:hypothetical protein [Salegentibacter salinarum]SKB37907.1 hypothetical protein SAMN05660903_00492 [Salegentibacter salinarum]